MTRRAGPLRPSSPESRSAAGGPEVFLTAGRSGPSRRRTPGGRIPLLVGALCFGWLVSGCGGGDSSTPAPATPRPAPVPTPEPVPTPAPNCGGLEVETAHEGVRREEYESLGASFTIRGPNPETAVDVVRPYRDGGRYPPPSWAFVESFDFRRIQAGIERTLRIEWIGSLALDIRTPDCPPLRVECGADDCVLDPEDETSQ